MKSQTQVEFQDREARLAEIARTPGSLESRLEALGVRPAGLARLQRLAEQVSDVYCPAALADISPSYRIGVGRLNGRGGSSGVEIGRTDRAAVLAWAT